MATRLKIRYSDCGIFPGGWSVRPDEMHFTLRSVRYSATLNILEFGAGAGTVALIRLLDKYRVPFKYVSYEDKLEYMCKDPRVQTILWTDFPTTTVDGIFDLIIIDGPAGLSRTKWYPLIKKNVKPGTIILVDDYRHFTEFETALNANFKYRAVLERTQPHIKGQPQITWLIARVLAGK